MPLAPELALFALGRPRPARRTRAAGPRDRMDRVCRSAGDLRIADGRAGGPGAVRRRLRAGRAGAVLQAPVRRRHCAEPARFADDRPRKLRSARERVSLRDARLAARHDGPGVGARADSAVRRLRADVDSALRADRLHQARRGRTGSGAEVLPRRHGLVGGDRLRHVVHLRRHRWNRAGADSAGGARRPSGRAARHGPAARRTRIQDRGVPVPHVGAGHLRGSDHAVRRLAVGRAEDRGLRRHHPHLSSKASARQRNSGCRFSPRSPA